MEKFGLQKSEKTGVSPVNEKVGAEEQYVVQEPELGNYKLVQVERNEEGEDFNKKYEKLEHEAWRLTDEREEIYHLSQLEAQGLQTLFAEYGVDTVLELVQDPSLNQTTSHFTTFELINALEADKSKRDVLYDKIIQEQQKEAEQIELKDNHLREGGTFSYFSSVFGNAGNFVRGVQFRVQAMRDLDSVLGKISPSRKKYATLNGGRYGFPLTLVSQEKGEIFRQELAQAGDNIFNLTEQRFKRNNADTERLHAGLAQLQQELTSEVQRINDELNLKLEEYRALVLSDIAKVANIDVISEEVRNRLQDLLSKIEAEIDTKVKATEMEITEKTAPLVTMLNKTASLYRI